MTGTLNVSYDYLQELHKIYKSIIPLSNFTAKGLEFKISLFVMSLNLI